MLRLILPIALVATVSCALADDGKEPVAPPLAADGKVDSAGGGVVLAGTIENGVPARGFFQLSRPHQGHAFYARAGTHVTIQLGTALPIDTLLYLYGPYVNGSWGSTYLAVNDDVSRSDESSRLSDVTLPDTGLYLAVASQRGGKVGGFTIELGCEGGCWHGPEVDELAIVEVLTTAEHVDDDTNADGTVDVGDRFVELVNRTSIPTNLAGVALESRVNGAWTLVHQFEHPTVLAPGQAAVVFNRYTDGDRGPGGSVAVAAAPGLESLAGTVKLRLRIGEQILTAAELDSDQLSDGSAVLLDSDGVNERWMGHLVASAGKLRHSAGTAVTSEPYENPLSRVPGEEIDVELVHERAAATARAEAVLSRELGTETSFTSSISDPDESLFLLRTLHALADGLLSRVARVRPTISEFSGHMVFVNLTSDPIMSVQSDGAFLDINLDYRTDPRAWTAVLAEHPETEPALLEYRAEEREKLARLVPAALEIDPVLAGAAAGPEAFSRELDGLDNVTVLDWTIEEGDTTSRARTRRYSFLLTAPGIERLDITHRTDFRTGSMPTEYLMAHYFADAEGTRPLRTLPFYGGVVSGPAHHYLYEGDRLANIAIVDPIAGQVGVLPINPVKLSAEAIGVRTELPSDPLFERLVDRLHPNERWFIGVLDRGFDYNHPELAANTLSSGGSDPLGWDFVDDDEWPYDLTINHGEIRVFGQGHGTMVSCLAAQGSDRIAPIVGRVHSNPLVEGTREYSCDEMVDFLVGQGVRVVNMSFSSAIITYDCIVGHPDVLFVTSAGNDGRDLSEHPTYPGAFVAPNLMTVAALDGLGQLASTSNHDEDLVHVATLGESVFTCLPGGRYGYRPGTSLASPVAANSALKVWAIAPHLSPAEVRQILIATSDPRNDLQGKLVAEGALNARTAESVAYLVALTHVGLDPHTAAGHLGVDDAELSRLMALAEEHSEHTP